MSARNFTPLVARLPSTVPFVGPEAQERARGSGFKARIGANESVFGPSPKAVEAMKQAAAETWMYADPENHDLKRALAEYHGVRPENVVVGEGIDGLLGYTARMFVESGVKVVTSLGAYPTFNFHVDGFGGELVKVPYRDDREDPQALIETARSSGARLIYISNPDNPMGTWWDADTIQQMIQSVPEGAVLLLDEAYCEFAPDGAIPPIDTANPNVLRYRTFSKARGMAGARIGYAIGEAELIRGFDKIRNHFGVNRVAQAGALAALGDEDHLRDVVAKVVRARARIGEIAAANGLEALPSAANFVAIDCGRDGDYARSVLSSLVERDVFVRMPGVSPQDRCIRVSAGTEADLGILAETLPIALAHA
ncbi:MAG: pyridoxal phosphate-dependent aminotransferase [Pseudomonadota bacterium]